MIGAEERGQAWVIAENMYEMSRLETPIICIVIGEGGSGGALGIGVADRVDMLQYAWYSVISPEGCASILWKSADKAQTAATAMKITSETLKQNGLVDEVVSEPLGGAHRDPDQTADQLRVVIREQLHALNSLATEELLRERDKRLRSFGRFKDES